MTPRLEVLHVPGCPNLAMLLARLRQVSDLPVLTREIATNADAAAAGMSGSPTLLVDGTDPFRVPRQSDGAISCRIYLDEHGRRGAVPSAEQLRKAIQMAPGPTTAAELLSSARGRAMPMDPTERATHRAILRGFADTGHAPPVEPLAALAQGSGRSPAEILAALHDLDAIRLDAEGRIAVAYPFSGRPTRHRVRVADRVEVYAMCAVDALGIAPMLGRDTHIEATDPATGRPVAITTVAGRASWDPPEAVVFVGAAGAEGPSADRCCDHLNFVVDRAAAEAWAHSHPHLRGQILDHDEAMVLAAELFGSLLS